MATVRRPSSVAARMTRIAISERLATSNFFCGEAERGWREESDIKPAFLEEQLTNTPARSFTPHRKSVLRWDNAHGRRSKQNDSEDEWRDTRVVIIVNLLRGG